jgi:transposase
MNMSKKFEVKVSFINREHRIEELTSSDSYSAIMKATQLNKHKGEICKVEVVYEQPDKIVSFVLDNPPSAPMAMV